MKKGQQIKVISEAFKSQVTFFEVVILGNDLPSFAGEVVAVNPTKEELATLNENFADAVEAGVVEDVLEGQIVYFDSGANRNFLLYAEDVETTELN